MPRSSGGSSGYYYLEAPWTRDGRVRADVVQVAADVSGLVSDVLVHDNEAVKKGQVLFRIDPARFEIALRDAQGNVDSKLAAEQEAERETNRYNRLNALSVSEEQQQQRGATASEAEAAYQQALASRDLAGLNLARTQVRAPVNGFVTNFDMRPGDYIDAGKPLFALIDSDSFYVDGYFEETKLPRIKVGDPARVYLVGESVTDRGPCREHRGRHRRSGAAGQRRPARQREPHIQLGQVGAARAGSDRNRPRASRRASGHRPNRDCRRPGSRIKPHMRRMALSSRLGAWGIYIHAADYYADIRHQLVTSNSRSASRT